MTDMILIKLGGSIITNKEKPLSVRHKIIHNITNVIKKINEPVIVVHGGGSFGHYWSVKYNMHTKPANYNIHGVSVVKNSMVELNKIILDSFLKNKLSPYGIPPTSFVKGNKPINNKIKEMQSIAKSGLIPVTYGDALWYQGKKSFILSGDKIMTMIARVLRPRLCIFVMNVDGLYSDVKNKKLIYKMESKIPKMDKNKIDVTGGMTRKVDEALKISKMGVDVFFANGNKPLRIIGAIKNTKMEGTLFKGK